MTPILSPMNPMIDEDNPHCLWVLKTSGVLFFFPHKCVYKWGYWDEIYTEYL